MNLLRELYEADPEIFEVVLKETQRQHETLELIASENFTHPAVLAAMGSALTNKYAEGYPGKRYYGGCVWVDVAEELARKRAMELFGAQWANVQPHSGTQANMAVYFATLQPGDRILAMELSHGGHLSHGSPVNFSGKLYEVHYYGVNPDTERLEKEDILKIAKEVKPKIIVTGYSAYPRAIDFKMFREIADEVGALLLVDMAHIAGLIAAGEHPDPVPYADFVSSTTHKTLRGPRGGFVLTTEEHKKDLDKAVFPGMQGGPLMHVIAAKAVAFKLAMGEDFKAYQRQIRKNAQALAQTLIEGGLRLVSGGTDNHLMLIDLRPEGLTGKDTEHALEEAGMTVNKNTIPYDPQKPWITSGIRVGVPALTTRGMKEPEMRRVGEMIVKVIKSKLDRKVIEEVRKEARELSEAFPLYKALREEMERIMSA